MTEYTATKYVNHEKIVFKTILAQAWSAAKGVRLRFIGYIFTVFFITFFCQLVAEIALSAPGMLATIVHITANILIMIFVSYPLYIGLSMLAISRTRGLPINIKNIFNFFKPRIFLEVFKLLLWTALLFCLVAVVVFSLAYSIGIDLVYQIVRSSMAWLTGLLIILLSYFSLVYLFVLPLIADKNLTAGKALLVGFKGINRYLGIVFSLIFCIVSTIFAIIAAIMFMPVMFKIKVVVGFVAAMVWSFYFVPYLYLLAGCLYNKIFLSPAAMSPVASNNVSI